MCENSPQAVRNHWVHKTFWTKEKRGGGVLDFRSEGGQFTGSGGRAEPHDRKIRLGDSWD